jgi:carbon monoxide dehydrogenase subunit G
MQLENSFEVAVPPAAAWELLTDVPAVLPCMPGAELLEVVDDDRWKARLQVRLGPISLQFLADLTREETDVAARRAVLAVAAREAKGRGTAQATITSSVEEAGGGSRVSILTELVLRGPLAQYGGVVVAPVAEQLTEQFAVCIGNKLAAATAETREVAEPIGGLRLLLAALWRSLRRRDQTPSA